MTNKQHLAIVLLSAIIITALFHNQSPGLNVLIYETCLFIWLAVSTSFRFTGLNRIVCSIGVLSTALFSVLTNSPFSIFLNLLSGFIFVGILIYPEAKSLLHTFGLSASNILSSQLRFVRELSELNFNNKKLDRTIKIMKIFIIPVLIIFIFIAIYRNANPVFDNLMVSIDSFLGDSLQFLFKDFDFTIIVTFLIGLLFSSFILLRTSNRKIEQSDRESTELLTRDRVRHSSSFRFTSLKNEYKAGVFLLIVLNSILLVLNAIDINWVWFNFQWDGQFLKQFVHEATDLLILSIFISLALVLFYFRRNLNFYQGNTLLKVLTYIWLFQNAILAVSVGIRNFWYINYFALAHKRIGVIIFLVLTMYCIYTIYIKVKERKSAFYLFKSNAFAFYVVLVVSSFINWESFIVNYNFRNADKSYLDLGCLEDFPDQCLADLDKPLSELSRIDTIQKAKFSFVKTNRTPEKYHSIIEKRKQEFKKRWESQGVLSWNLPEYLAYQELFVRNPASH